MQHSTGGLVQTLLGLPVFRARTVIEAEAGAFGRWGLHLGDVIEVRE